MPDLTIKKIEEKILKFWNDRDIFARSLKEREGKKRFVFFDGPPTANGKPGIHHFIGRVFKDLIPRYKTMRGYYVLRKAGWDTHGLPVEIEVEKELGLTTKKDIEKYGIAKFNTRAKKSVWKYKEEWQKFTKRIGFWLDMAHPYITYEPHYMESLWWIIGQFDKKKLLYEGHKVLPWCPRCGTALSSHEVAQGYQDVTETSVYIKLKAIGQDFSFLAWTTTPWTLPGNVALAVGEEIDYVLTDGGYVVAKGRLEAVLGKDAKIVRELKGKELVGIKYQPLFDIAPLRTKKSHQVYAADFVTTTDGTGIVHTAVMYGEDDYELGKKLGLPMHHTVAEDGTFTSDVPEFAGQNVKAAEKGIIEYLQAKSYLLKAEPYSHSYPFCWRCKHALLYYARNSWFVAMSKLRKQLLKNNSKINWVPGHLRDGRFGEFLKEAKDWAFSRERYWGTPLPVWKCKECKQQRVIGSLAELDAFRYEAPNTYILLRHGESTKNVPVDTLAGKLENDTHHLTQAGIDQVTASLEDIKAQGGVDLIVSSPFLRAKETAEVVAKAYGIPVAIDERLVEIFEGSMWDGKPVDEYLAAHQNWGYLDKDGDGESRQDVKERVSAVVRDLEKKHHGKRIAIVSHGDSLWLLKSFLLNIPKDKLVKHFDGTDYPIKGIPEFFMLSNYPYSKSGELDLHRPYIDEIHLKCDQCQGKMIRVKEVVDVWFDSGAMPFAQWHYPFENDDVFKQSFPADFITEAIDQTRGWFYTMLAVATALGKKAPYKNVVCYSHVLDAKGKKMSKSIGNVVNPWDVIEAYGADATRWYFYSVNNPGDPKLFALEDVAKVQRGFLMTLMNCLRFYELYETPGANHAELKPKPAEPLDDWILSRLHGTIQVVTQALDSYDPTLASRTLEHFVVEDLSKWWIRRSRDRFPGAAELLRYLLIKTSKLAAPFIPFTAEHIYKRVSNRSESVHLEDWPRAEAKYIRPELEAGMQKIRELVTLGLAERKKANIKVRQPLGGLGVKEKIDPDLERYIKDEVNVKAILFAPSQEEPVVLDTAITHELKLEGYAREISRAIQEMRKDAGYQMGDVVSVFWESASPEAQHAVAMLKDIKPKGNDGTYDVIKEFDLAPGIKLWLGIKR
ncbi:MAG: class I tRNA ligase family protein [Patescibacteria group bacterium]